MKKFIKFIKKNWLNIIWFLLISGIATPLFIMIASGLWCMALGLPLPC